MKGPFPKACVWCGTEFAAKHPLHKCCSPACSNREMRRRNRLNWPVYYAANRQRLSAHYAAYHVANREARNKRASEYQKRRWANMTEAEREAYQAHRRERDAARRLVLKVAEHWNVGCAEARAMIEAGTFPP